MTKKTEAAAQPRAVVARRALDTAFQRSAELLRGGEANAEALRRIFLNALTQNPEIANCTEASLYQVFSRAIQDDILPNGDEAQIIVRNVGGMKVATWMPMYRGLLRVFLNAYPGSEVRTMVVYEEDEFEWEEGLETRLRHKPSVNGEHDTESIIAAYAVIEIPGNRPRVEVMWKSDIDGIRALSKSTAWRSQYGEMARKTVLKRALKLLATRHPALSRLISEADEVPMERDITPEKRKPEVIEAEIEEPKAEAPPPAEKAEEGWMDGVEAVEEKR